MPYLPIHSRSPTDHSCKSRNLFFITPTALILERMTTIPYLPIHPRSPTDHSCESRNLFFITPTALDNTALPLLLIEIPAFAGMVCRGTEDCLRIGLWFGRQLGGFGDFYPESPCRIGTIGTNKERYIIPMECGDKFLNFIT